MAQVSVTIDNRKYRLACNEGEEARLESLAGVIDSKIGELRAAFGEIGDQRLVVMAALTIADNLAEARDAAEAERDRMKTVEAQAMTVAAGLDQLSSRIEFSGCAARRRRGDLNLRKSRRALIALAVDLSWGWRAFDFTASWPGLSRPSTRLCFCEAGRLPANKKISSHQLSHTAHGKVGLIK